MIEGNENGDLTMLAATLRELVSSGRLTVRQMAEATGYDESSFYRWMSGDTDPGFTRVQQLFAHCNCPHVQSQLLHAFTRGTSTAWTILPEDLDINGDGQVDGDDAMLAAIEALGDLQELLRGIHDTTALTDDGRVSEDQVVRIGTHVQQAVTGAFAARGIVEAMFERQSRRRHARPITGNGHDRPGLRNGGLS